MELKHIRFRADKSQSLKTGIGGYWQESERRSPVLLAAFVLFACPFKAI